MVGSSVPDSPPPWQRARAYFHLLKLYWPLTLILFGWVAGLTGLGFGLGWTLAKVACGAEP